MIKPYRIALELYFRGTQRTAIRYQAGDAGVYPLELALRSGGNVFEIPDGAEAGIIFADSRGQRWERAAEIAACAAGIVRYLLSPEDVMTPGQMSAALTLSKGQDRLTWPRFAFEVLGQLPGAPPAQPPPEGGESGSGRYTHWQNVPADVWVIAPGNKKSGGIEMALEAYTNIKLKATPQSPEDAVNVKFVQDYFTGRVKMPVRAVSLAHLAGTYDAAAKTLTLGVVGPAMIDSVSLAENDRLLLAGQNDGTQNGIYILSVFGDGTTAAAFTRAADFDASEKIYPGVRVAVAEGTQYADTDWKLATDGTIILDATALTFIPATASNGTTKYAATITGDSLMTEFNILHALGTSDVAVSIRSLTTNAAVLADVTVRDNETITIGFAEAPTAAQNFRVVVVG